ncbi:hypothetical protein [Stratiformator vulcanicus]|uniref:Uncharacterized protein n=1 Tax=Stratiformator vulcanicus TaxID=2527980 RepID=A0A517R430_9PLAN|nr:hypothetical protein [Stratiformator vulcanicus]QDT38607.1 hypothetical protein Pan189_30020 [Stratiformator vulcanicus]
MAKRRNPQPVDLPTERLEIVHRLVVFAEGRDPADVTVERFTEETGINNRRIYRHFKSWLDLREEAGLPRRVAGRRQYSDDELMIEYYSLTLKLRRLPTFAEINQHARMSDNPFRNRFGSMDTIQRKFRKWLKTARKDLNEMEMHGEAAPDDGGARLVFQRWSALKPGFALKSSEYRTGERIDRHHIDFLVVMDHDWPGCPWPVVLLGNVWRGQVASEDDESTRQG